MRSSLTYWFPRIRNLGIPVPKTAWVEVDELELIRGIENPSVLMSYKSTLVYVARKVGFPCFMRTDHFSGKHNYLSTCYVERERDIIPHLRNLVEESEIHGLPIKAIVFREFIELDWRFKAFNGLPIAPERRYFIRDGEVVCHHPYWPEDAIKFWRSTPEPDGWREMLREMNRETLSEIRLLKRYARKVASVLDGYWSVDFAKARDGTWYLIDMAEGEYSWHPESCPYSKTVSLPV